MRGLDAWGEDPPLGMPQVTLLDDAKISPVPAAGRYAILCSSGDDAKPEAECRWVRVVPGTMWMLRSLASAWYRGR